MLQDNDSGFSPEEIKRFLEVAQELHTSPDEDGNIISSLTKDSFGKAGKKTAYN